MELFTKYIRKISNFTFFLGCAALIFSVLLITINIVIRLFGKAFQGSVEIVVNVNVLIAFMGLGLCALEDGHIKVDIIKKWPFLDRFCAILTMVGMIVFGYCAVVQTQLNHMLNTQTAVLGIVKWPFFIVTAIGYFSTTLALVSIELNHFAQWLRKRKSHTELSEERV